MWEGVKNKGDLTYRFANGLIAIATRTPTGRRCCIRRCVGDGGRERGRGGGVPLHGDACVLLLVSCCSRKHVFSGFQFVKLPGAAREGSNFGGFSATPRNLYLHTYYPRLITQSYFRKISFCAINKCTRYKQPRIPCWGVARCYHLYSTYVPSRCLLCELNHAGDDKPIFQPSFSFILEGGRGAVFRKPANH